MKYFLSAIILATLILSLSCKSNIQTEQTIRPQNIILMIGDGMGLTQVSTSFYYNDKPSNFLRFKHIGLHQPMPTSHKVTDSAAGATAFACGVKTYNGAIGVDPDTLPVPSILEMLADQGLSTGLIATSSITHATPASFFGHTAFRSNQEILAAQLVHAPVHFLAGGGKKYFNQRDDKANYLDSLRKEGFKVDTTKMVVMKDELIPSQKYAYLLAEDGMPKMQDGRGDFLPIATQTALDYLSQDPEGFFLMVEGSQIDWGGHANDAQYIIEEMKDFDKAVGVAVSFARQQGNTLVIVTADHETGGFSLSAATIYGKSEYGKITPTFSTGNHSATLIPVFAYGPGAENFMGIYQNSDIFDKMLKAYRFKKTPRKNRK